MVVLFWLVRIIITKDYKFTSLPLNKAMLLFLVSILVSGVDAWGIKFLDEVSSFILLVLFYFAIINTVDNLILIKKLAYTTLFSMLIGVGYGLYQKFYLDMPRVGSFSFALSFGEFTAIFLMFTISYLLWSKADNKQKGGLLFLTVIIALNLLFTKSRGAWLAFIGGLSSLVWLKDKRIIIIFLICLLVLPLLLPQEYISRFKSSFNVTTNRSNLGRIALWKGSWLMYKDHPINGVGIGRFSSIYSNQYRQPHTTSIDHAHNNWLHLLATTGTIGVLAFGYLIFKILKLLYYGYYKINESNWHLFVLASLAAVIVFNIEGLTQYNLGDTETSRFFWYLVSLNSIVINKLVREGAKE
ncbi:lipid A core-O-antigen ligase-like enyme [Halobacteroides halobius DSM 5150]|uniref:Lipid A core-O-antigen ligase-like enyme n=1 Tax=Halobacteroides halobius (strain ATCC 35273 / DSM 5150 / MD-1) TaxID=748449 RepID=L0KDW5_HALHC|nr:O-antigen ligase family protein [Halobacteroides halobius]AGB42268.1 lipid A core-O-antigen ligase-like enyme [Halobacteroides halobius DSM 5150]